MTNKITSSKRTRLSQFFQNHVITRTKHFLFDSNPAFFKFAFIVYQRVFYFSHLFDKLKINYTQISKSDLRTIYLDTNINSQAIKTGIGRVESFFYEQLIAKELSGFRIVPVVWNGKTFILIENDEIRKSSHFFSRKQVPTWNPSEDDIFFFPSFISFKARDKRKFTYLKGKCKIVFSVYDIIPINHVEWFGNFFSLAFQRDFRLAWNLADLLVVNSEKVKIDIETYVAKNNRGFRKNKPVIKKVNLWSVASPNLNTQGISGKDSSKNIEIFSNTDPTLLLLSTVEPRKGHKEVIDAAKVAWDKGAKFNLLFVGQPGIISEVFKIEFQNFLEVESGRALWRNSVRDIELKELIRASSVLISPSLDEGYGLPVAEALQRGLPVLISGIPTYKELFKDHSIFYGPDERVYSLENAFLNIDNVISVGSNLLNSIPLPEIDSLAELVVAFEAI